MEDWRYASMVLDRLQVNIISFLKPMFNNSSRLHHLFPALHLLCCDGPRVIWHREGGTAHILKHNGTLPDRSKVVKDFTSKCGGKTPRGTAPRGSLTHEGVKPLLQSKREE